MKQSNQWIADRLNDVADILIEGGSVTCVATFLYKTADRIERMEAKDSPVPHPPEPPAQS